MDGWQGNRLALIEARQGGISTRSSADMTVAWFRDASGTPDKSHSSVAVDAGMTSWRWTLVSANSAAGPG